jgi:hypothetical protein
MRIIVGLVATLSLIVSNAALAEQAPPATGQLSVKDLKGSFGYLVSGIFGTANTTYDEVGVFIADGNGHITASGKTVIGGVVVVNPTYSCTYAVDAPPLFSRGFHVTCTRTQEVTPISSSPQFSIVLDDAKQEVRFLALPSAPPFDQVSITGTARAQ